MYTEANSIAWWKSASALEPSPIHDTAMSSSPLIAAAIAQPTACGNCVVRLPEIEKMRPSAQWYITGSCRPLHMSRVFDSNWHIRSTSGRPRTMYRPWLRYDGKQHVARAQRHALRHRHGFLAQAAHVERGLALPLRALHALVEDAREQHVPQTDLQVVHFEVRVPRADRHVAVVEHAHQVDREIADVAHARVDVGPRHRTRGRGLEIAEVRLLAGPRVVLRDVQS